MKSFLSLRQILREEIEAACTTAEKLFDKDSNSEL